MILALLLACTSGPPVILLVTLDTTRADAIGAYGRTPSPTPVLDALAHDGMRFTDASTVTPLTLPAHASLHSGLYPDRHGVRANDAGALSADVPLLAERLRAAGWRTGAFVSAVVLDRQRGLARGFEVYDAPPIRRSAVETTDRAQAWLEDSARGEAPIFLWVHYYDAHLPVADYHVAVAEMDRQIGNLREGLRLLGREERVWTVVASDHGESRGEHGESSHGLLLYRATVQIPLVVHGPDVRAATIDTPVSILDIAPTLLELAGLEPLPGIDGRSLLDAQPRPIYSETFHPRDQYGFSELVAVQDDRWRWIRSPRHELFEGGDETRERAASEPAVVDRLRGLLQAREAAWPRVEAGGGDPTRAALEALGYVVGGMGVEGDWSELPDPKSEPDVEDKVLALVVQARSRPPAEALPLLTSFHASHPHVATIRLLLARARGMTGDFAGAETALRPLVDARPKEVSLLSFLGELELSQGKAQAGVDTLERAIALAPEDPAACAVLGDFLRRTGLAAKADALLGECLRSAPGAATILIVRGAARMDLGDLEGAVRDLEPVLVSTPENRDVRYLLALSLGRMGREDEAFALLRAQKEAFPDDTRVDSVLE